MPEENTPPEQNKGGNEFTAITSQEQLNRLIGERINSVKSQYGDYDDLKAKAEKFDQAEQENLSELEKERKRAEAAEAKAATFEAKEQRAQWVADAVKDTDVPAALVRGSTKEEIEAHATALKDALAAKAPTAQRTATPPGKPAPGDGEKGRAAAALRALRQGT